MKKIIALLLCASMLCSSCATILSGRVDKCQGNKPAAGEPARKLRWGYVILDVALGGPVFLLIDFATLHVYKPCPKQK